MTYQDNLHSKFLDILYTEGGDDDPRLPEITSLQEAHTFTYELIKYLPPNQKPDLEDWDSILEAYQATKDNYETKQNQIKLFMGNK